MDQTYGDEEHINKKIKLEHLDEAEMKVDVKEEDLIKNNRLTRNVSETCRRYYYCFVPLCKNTTKTTPDKRFLSVPKNKTLRKKWWVAAHRVFPMLDHDCYCCEDHFNLEADAANYLYMQMMGGRAKLKEGVVPHKFECQGRHKTQNEKRVSLARKRLIQELLNDK